MLIVDTSGLKPLTDRLQSASRNFPRDARRALVSTRRTTITQATKAAIGEYTVKRKALRDQIIATNVDRATLSFELRGLKATIPLQQFEHVATSMFGVSVKVNRTSGAKRLPGAFKATVARFGGGGSSDRIFIRAVRNGKRVARLPIKALFGPSAADMIDSKPVQTVIISTAQAKLTSEMLRLIKVAISGKN